jgi:hypothetical protein
MDFMQAERIKDQLTKIPIKLIKINDFQKNENKGTTQVVLTYSTPKYGIGDAIDEYRNRIWVAHPNKTQKKKNKLEYQFKVPNIEMIDMDEISLEISKLNPIACITMNEYRFIIVHRTVLQKASILNIQHPKNWKRKNTSANAMVFQLMPNTFTPDIFNESEEVLSTITASSFKRSLIWIRKVQKAEWGIHKVPVTAQVIIPNL